MLPTKAREEDELIKNLEDTVKSIFEREKPHPAFDDLDKLVPGLGPHPHSQPQNPGKEVPEILTQLYDSVRKLPVEVRRSDKHMDRLEGVLSAILESKELHPAFSELDALVTRLGPHPKMKLPELGPHPKNQTP